MTESKSNTVVEGRIGPKSFAELLSEVIENRHGDRLSDEELSEAVQVAKGIHKMETTDSFLAKGKGGQTEVLRDKYGIDYDRVARGAKFLRNTEEAECAEFNSDDLSHGFESYDSLIQEIESRDCDPSDLTVVADPDGEIKRLVQELNEADVDPSDVVVGRKTDVQDAKSEKESLRQSISDAKGISPDELENLSLPALRRLNDSDGGRSGPTPAPKSKSAKKGNIPRGQEEKAAELREQKEFLKDRSGVLAEKRLKHIEEELEELKS